MLLNNSSQPWMPKTKKPGAIFDMDGTLADVSSIRWHVNLNDERNTGHKDFSSFHAVSIGVPAHEWVVALAQAVHNAGVDVWIVTARKFKWRYHTVVWLYDNQVPYYTLQMRPDADIRSDVFVKEDIVKHIRKTHDILFAVDDNPHVIKLWEDENIPVIVVPGWESNALPGTVFNNDVKKTTNTPAL